MSITSTDGGIITAPTLFFTLASQANSLKVLESIRENAAEKGVENQHYVIFPNMESVAGVVGPLYEPKDVVVLFDSPRRYDNFLMLKRSAKSGLHIPEWSRGALWIVVVGPKCTQSTSRIRTCALQCLGVFGKSFVQHMTEWGQPWGKKEKKTERASAAPAAYPRPYYSRVWSA